MSVLYSGPGKAYFNALGFQADGENGQINAVLEEKTTQRGTAMFGRAFETLDDQLARITLTPFDNYGLIGTLFPKYLGVTAPAGSGTIPGGTAALAIGQRPHDYWGAGVDTAMAAQIYTYDGRLYVFNRGAITKHPNMKLGVGQPLFEGIELTCLWAVADSPGGMETNFVTITETAPNVAVPPATGGDPGGPYTTSDFVNGAWTGVYGSGTPAGFSALQAEDYWTLTSEIKYSPLAVSRLTRHFKLDSVNFMVKARLIGPTHTQLMTYMLSRSLGQKVTNIVTGTETPLDLVLSGPNSKTLTLKNCTLKGAGFEFGGTRLGTGEIGFVTNVVPSAGAPPATLIFT